MIEEPGKKVAMVIMGVLWLVTAVLSVICVITAREIVLRTIARFDLSNLIPFANWVIMFIMVFFAIAVIIGGFEYHFRKAGTEESWRMFSYTLAAEAAILLLAGFI